MCRSTTCSHDERYSIAWCVIQKRLTRLLSILNGTAVCLSKLFRPMSTPVAFFWINWPISGLSRSSSRFVTNLFALMSSSEGCAASPRKHSPKACGAWNAMAWSRDVSLKQLPRVSSTPFPKLEKACRNRLASSPNGQRGNSHSFWQPRRNSILAPRALHTPTRLTSQNATLSLREVICEIFFL
jgi:hypothetical protein